MIGENLHDVEGRRRMGQFESKRSPVFLMIHAMHQPMAGEERLHRRCDDFAEGVPITTRDCCIGSGGFRVMLGRVQICAAVQSAFLRNVTTNADRTLPDFGT